MSIQSVKRAITILTLFTPERPKLGITEISKLMNLPKPTIHGLVQTLIQQDFLIQDKETRKYSLGLKIYELGIFLSGTLKINQVGGGISQRLAKNTGQMVRLGIWDRDWVLITMNLFPTVDDSFLIRQLGLGPRVPAHCTGLGKAMLSTFSPGSLKEFLERNSLSRHTSMTLTDPKILISELETARKHGVSREREEYLKGLSCIAAPIFDDVGEATAAISLSGGPDFLTHQDLNGMTDQLLQTAAEISLGMGCPISLIMGGKHA
ncbi:MAG: IclR family transcriptional regulator [Proteobacteria bacterium]|nr:IclR family transcriptional regulator [Pseudomonadota bacterium]